MTQPDFWNGITEKLASHAKYQGTQERSEAHKQGELSAYASQWQEIRAILDPWTEQLRRHGFEVTHYEIDHEKLLLHYSKRGYLGIAGFGAVLDAANNLVASWIPRGSSGDRTETHTDTEKATHLGRRFTPDALQAFLQYNLLAYIDESNLCLTADAHRERYVDYLGTQFHQLATMRDRQAAGRQFQDFLDRLFTMEGLGSRGSFRIQGEEIDGSFVLDGHTYLVEAKWVKDRVGPEPLDHFQNKMRRKSMHARGVFIAINGVTASAAQTIRLGDSPRFFIVTGHEIQAVIEGSKRLSDLLRQRQRQFDEEGRILLESG